MTNPTYTITSRADLGGDSCLSEELSVSVEAAAVLLSLAMRDTERPVADLGGALGRLNEQLRNGGCDDRQAIEQQISVCIRSLQFHDRLMQQLAAVRNLLAGLADHHAMDVTGFGAQRWEELLKMLRERFTTDSQHELFELLLRTGAIESDPRGMPPAAAEGSVELF